MPIKEGTYYATRTLLHSIPDRNTRFVYRWPDDKPIVILNVEMDPWESEDERDLQHLLLKLNEPPLAYTKGDGLAKFILVATNGTFNTIMKAPGFIIDRNSIPGSIIITPMNGETNAE
jgi:hypothetical protein